MLWLDDKEEEVVEYEEEIDIEDVDVLDVEVEWWEWIPWAAAANELILSLLFKNLLCLYKL